MREETLIYDFIIENEIATESETDLVTSISGYSVETLNDIIECRTSYHDIEQLWDCEQDCYYFNDEVKEYYSLEDDESDESDESED